MDHLKGLKLLSQLPSALIIIIELPHLNGHNDSTLYLYNIDLFSYIAIKSREWITAYYVESKI